MPMQALNIETIVVNEIDAAFKRCPGSTGSLDQGAVFSPHESSLASIAFELNPAPAEDDNEYHAYSQSYVYRGQDKRFVRVAGEIIYIPAFEVFSSVSDRCTTWLQCHEAEQQMAVARRLLLALQNTVSFRRDGVVADFLEVVAKAESNSFSWEDKASRIIEILRDEPTQLVVPPELRQLAEHLLSQGVNVTTNQVLNPKTALLLPHEKLGILRSETHLMAWCNPESGEFGLSAPSLVGMAVTKPNHLSRIEFQYPDEAIASLSEIIQSSPAY